MHATIPKGDMGYDQYTVPDTVAVEPTFNTRQHTFMVSLYRRSVSFTVLSLERRILSNY